MKFTIKHELKGRIRIHLHIPVNTAEGEAPCYQRQMTVRQADLLLYYLMHLGCVTGAKVYDRTADVAVNYSGSRNEIIDELRSFSFTQITALEELVPHDTGRGLNREYKEKLIQRVLLRLGKKLFLPAPIQTAITTVQSIRYLYHGLRVLADKRLEVEVLDATAIGVSLLRGDYDTASSVMFLLGIGELLEEWTHKKSVGDLARSMSLNIDRVWQVADGTDVLVPVSKIQEGDLIRVHVGNMIPLDGTIVDGEAMINQASMTGESLPVKKETDMYVYAGTVVEEGEITLCVKKTAGSTRFERIVTMIEESERLKSSLEGKAATLADALVPWSLGGTLLTWLITRNTTKALAILMVDFSCALKLAMPLAVLSAIREAGEYHITIKGGKFMEAVAAADTIVFDKTGTLTKAQPTVADIVAFRGRDKNEMLRLAACLEEHFPHSMANAVVAEAKKRNLEHEEMHSKVQYVVAHGISSYVGDKHVIVGSHHFVFEDEGCIVPEEERHLYEQLPPHYSLLYMAIENELAAVICIEDPLRKEAGAVIEALRRCGLTKIVMMTGDSERTACAVAKEVGVDEYYSEVLPEDKARFVEEEKVKGRKVIMIGDGINDSPALSAADVGIAISGGAQIAREIADITIAEDDLYRLVTLKLISNSLMNRIECNYRFVIGFNLSLIILGVGGFLAPSTSALLHNISTLGVSIKSMTNLLEEKNS
ncbi:MAG: heavy metal translocating P-type ATPase [Lachnospiraceae bacterium]